MNARKRLGMMLIVLCTTCLLPAIACPRQCSCKWRDGKRAVNCTRQHLMAISRRIDPETQVLDISFNNLRELEKNHFIRLNLPHLQKVYLHNCRLKNIHNQAFYGLSNLVELNLSNNNITITPCANFQYTKYLMSLSLNNNPITTIKTNCFRSLLFLMILELTGCKIEFIEMDAFSGLRHLEWLRLDGNKLSNIPGEYLFPTTLRGIDLQNNNWNCDCHLRNLHGWLSNINIAHAVEPICSLPERLRKRKITKVPENELACLPKINPTTMFLETNFGGNVTLECQVKAIPEAKITWLYQDQIIQNYSSDMLDARELYFNENGNTDKKGKLILLNVEDNGTYSCLAENPAGRSRANFTINVLAKEESEVVVVTFPYRHLVVIVTVIFLVVILLIAIIAVILLKLKTNTRSRKKKESGNDVALCNQILPSSRDNAMPKNNSSLIVDAHSHQINRDYELNNVYRSNTMTDFVDRNPDLISDAETVANNAQNEKSALSVYKAQIAGDKISQEETAFTTPIMQIIPRQVTWQDQQNMNVTQNTFNNIYQHSADVHLNPGCFLDNEGYPYDYGLPKHPCRQPKMSNYSVAGPCYQTLPHNRPKGQKLVYKLTKDTEFNATPPTFPNLEMLGPGNVRRTLDDYTVPKNRQIAFVDNGTVYFNEEFVPSPPEGYKSEKIQCCTPPEASPKGTCAVMVPMNVSDGPSRCYQVETRCVDTQTNDARMPGESNEKLLKHLPQVSNAKCVADICTESPGEGYVGDANDF